MRRALPPSIRPYKRAEVLADLDPYAWYEFDALALADGAAVASVTDSSGNGWTLTQGTALKRPTFDAARAMIRGSAANVTALPSGVIPAMSNPYTVVVVGMAPTTTPSATQYLTGGNSNGSRRDVFYNTNRTFGLQGSAGTNGSVTAPPEAGFIVSGIYDAASSKIRHDSIPLAGSTGNTGTSAPVQIIVGARNGQTTSFDGWIGEVLYFPRRLEEVELIRLERYLSKKWDIPLTPPGQMHVNPAVGSDTANTGRSSDSPLATVAKANTVLSASDGRIEITGEVREFLGVQTGQGARLLKMAEGATWYASERHTSGWTSMGGGIYRKAVSGYDTTLNHARIVSDLDDDGFWTTLTGLDANGNLIPDPTLPAEGQCGLSGGFAYVHLEGGADPNGKTIELAKLGYCINAQAVAPLVVRNGTFYGANRSNIAAGSAGTDGKILTLDVVSAYGGSEGCYATQNDATWFRRYRCESFRGLNDGGNWHGTTGRAVEVYSEDCEDHHNTDEGESAHNAVLLTIRGGRKHHNYTGGGITDVQDSVLDADGSANGPLICDFNRSAENTAANQGGISIYDAASIGYIGPRVICRNNNGAGIYINPGSTESTVDDAAIRQSGGNALPDTLPA